MLLLEIALKRRGFVDLGRIKIQIGWEYKHRIEFDAQVNIYPIFEKQNSPWWDIRKRPLILFLKGIVLKSKIESLTWRIAFRK